MGAKWFANPCEVNEHSYFYIENVFEELDAPGEWYLDKQLGILYYLPPPTVDLDKAVVEVPLLDQAIRFLGTQDTPVCNLTVRGLRITQTRSTFLAPYTIPSLSDWAVHRGGACFLEGTRACAIEECYFDAVGGNAVFLNGYNRGSRVIGCKFTETGDSAICLVGSLETTVGTQRNFPYECQVSNNLIHDCGVFGKQIAGVYISRAKRITVAHNEIHHMPIGTKYSLAEWQQLGFDQHSIFADPLFVDPANGDYRVQPDSPALQVGFQNFPMDQFGLLPDFPSKWRAATA